MKVVNKTGIAEISNFLREYHVLGNTIANNDCLLSSWVSNAQNYANSIKPGSWTELKTPAEPSGVARVYIGYWESMSGISEVFYVSESGIDTIKIVDEMGE